MYGSNEEDKNLKEADEIQRRALSRDLEVIRTDVEDLIFLIKGAAEIPFKRFQINVGLKGNMIEHVDFHSLVLSYVNLAKGFGDGIMPVDADYLNFLMANNSFAKYLTEYDFDNPVSVEECIMTGFALGYPIESTFAFITDGIKA